VPATDALAVVVVAHNSAAHLPGLIDSLLEQLGPADELVVVDNGSSDGTAALAAAAGERVVLIESGVNLGFGAGCHAGARATGAPLLLFLNPDCRPEPGCVEALRGAAAAHPGWGAWQAAVLLPDGNINTDGGVVHYIGIGWAGDCDKPVSAMPPDPYEVAFPSGAALVVRRSVWDELGGLEASYFLYSEDLDLGLRLWLAGHRVGIVPGARVVHGYEFDKGAGKWFWLERNRWRTVLAVYPPALLVLLAPALLAAELPVHLAAARGGWLGAKLRADAAVLAGVPGIFARRRRVQASRRISAREFASHLSASLDSPYLPVSDTHWAARGQAAYWAVVQRVL
jgi:N-acetylglucosaminyl-diphospho-decaprenol L-rhamnosyltransferase